MHCHGAQAKPEMYCLCSNTCGVISIPFETADDRLFLSKWTGSAIWQLKPPNYRVESLGIYGLSEAAFRDSTLNIPGLCGFTDERACHGKIADPIFSIRDSKPKSKFRGRYTIEWRRLARAAQRNIRRNRNPWRYFDFLVIARFYPTYLDFWEDNELRTSYFSQHKVHWIRPSDEIEGRFVKWSLFCHHMELPAEGSTWAGEIWHSNTRHWLPHGTNSSDWTLWTLKTRSWWSWQRPWQGGKRRRDRCLRRADSKHALCEGVCKGPNRIWSGRTGSNPPALPFQCTGSQSSFCMELLWVVGGTWGLSKARNYRGGILCPFGAG